MPVYNVAPFVDEAIASILAQTHRNFEFLIRDDGSTDGTGEKLERWARRDRRIQVFRGARQLGPAASSNWIVRQAAHDIVARMDGDDVSHPDRLRRQLAVLRSRPDVSLVGTLFRTIDQNGRVIRGRDRSRLIQPNALAPFAHGSIMYRRAAFDAIGGYRAQCDFWEDQDFFVRISLRGQVLVLPEALFDYRFNHTSTRLVSDRARVEDALDLGLRCLDAFAARGDYERVLREGPLRPLDPRAVVSVAHIELLARQPPHALPRLFGVARLEWNRRTARSLAWAIWAMLDPPSLRLASRLAGWLRDAIAARKVRDDDLYEWPLSRLARSYPAFLDALIGAAPLSLGESGGQPIPAADAELRPLAVNTP